MSKLLNSLFGCSHKHLTFPMTAKPGRGCSAARAMSGTYVVCLDCAKEFPYDWAQMKVIFVPRQMLQPMAESAPVSSMKDVQKQASRTLKPGRLLVWRGGKSCTRTANGNIAAAELLPK